MDSIMPIYTSTEPLTPVCLQSQYSDETQVRENTDILMPASDFRKLFLYKGTFINLFCRVPKM